MAENAVIGYLEKNEEISDSGKFADENGLSHDEIVNVIKSLNGFRLVDAQDVKRERWVLTEEGKTYAATSSPEFQPFSAILPEGITREELQKNLEPAIFRIGCQQAIKNRWIEMERSQVSKKVQQVDDRVKDLLLRIQNGEAVRPEEMDALKRRKLITLQVWKGYSVRKGPNYAPKRKKAATDLTRENLQRSDAATKEERKFQRKLEFYSKVRDTVAALSARKTITKKKRRSRREKKLKAYDLSSLSDYLPILEATTKEPRPTSFKLNSKTRQNLVLKEGNQLKAVINHHAFQSDPVGAIYKHLQSTQPVVEEKSKKDKKDGKKKEKSKKSKASSGPQSMDI